MTSFAFGIPVWYRIRGHEAFREDLAYKAIGFVCFGETGWSQLIFISDVGHTVGVQVHRCTALPPPAADAMAYPWDQYWRELSEREKAVRPAGKFCNPDIGT